MQCLSHYIQRTNPVCVSVSLAHVSLLDLACEVQDLGIRAHASTLQAASVLTLEKHTHTHTQGILVVQ